MKISRSIAITSVCVILGIMLAWQYGSINYNRQVASYQNKTLEDLKDELIMEKKNNEDLSKRLDELMTQNQKYESTRGNIDEQDKLLKQELERARVIAGLTDVKGKGVIVTLDKNDILSVDDSDILNVLNELRAAGAQAISVNDERMVATSEVRVAGRYIMVNGKQMLPPFEIKAIADPQELDYALKMVGGVLERLEELYHLKVKVEKSDNIFIPKVRDDGSIIKTDLLAPATSK